MRNNYAMLLLDQVLNGKLDKPFIFIPQDTDLKPISDSEIVFF